MANTSYRQPLERLTTDCHVPRATYFADRTSTSASVNYTVTGDKDIDCTTLSTTIGVDFTTKYISVINSIVQTSSK
ncbi:MAG: hypothetical protein ACKOPL_02330, partial [Acidimicrobiaceae bacterium]